jgi:hypothetical protein
MKQLAVATQKTTPSADDMEVDHDSDDDEKMDDEEKMTTVKMVDVR